MLKDRDGGGSPVTGVGGGDLGSAGCAGCGGRINDRFYLLAVDRQWHSSCLKCCECKLPLDSELTCFARADNIYCKEDYYRLFAVKRCARCQAGISARELVMRARDFVYHVHCFTCAQCQRPLSRGDHFGMRDGLVFCRSHFEELQMFAPSPGGGHTPSIGHHPLHQLHQGIECCGAEEELADFASGAHGATADLQAESPGRGGGGAALSPFFNNNANAGQKGRPRKRKNQDSDLQNVGLRIPPVLEMLHPGELAGPLEQLAFDSSSASSPGNPNTGSSGGQQSGQRTKRMRTSFKHHQLRTMKSYFALNQNPDAKDLKQLAQKTGLSKRVLQVWFQNARAKWRRNMMRQENNHQQPGVPSGQMDSNGGVLAPGSVSSSGQSHMGESLSLQSAPPPLMDDNSGQTLAFSDLY